MVYGLGISKRAQVEDIVKRKTNVAAENIIITPIQNSAEASQEGAEEGNGAETPENASGENAGAGQEEAAANGE